MRDEQQGICDQSGFKFPMRELVRQWDGALVHYRFVDRRNPQDFLRAKPDNRLPPRSRPEAANQFVASASPYLTDDGEPITEGGETILDS